MASTFCRLTSGSSLVSLSRTAKCRGNAGFPVVCPARASPCSHLPMRAAADSDSLHSGCLKVAPLPWPSNPPYIQGFRPKKRNQSLQVCHATEEVTELCQEIELETEEKMEKSVQSLKEKFNSVRTGRANASLLDRVEVDYYGAPVILKSLASISTPDASSILIQPFDKSSITAISKALLQSDLNLTPTNDGMVIRLNIPPLTGDRRKELVKTIGKLAEDGRIAIRNIRRDAIKRFEKLEKDGELSEDNLRDEEAVVQKLTDKYVKQVDALFKNKEEDILQV